MTIGTYRMTRRAGSRPARTVLVLLPVGVAVMVAVDALLGPSAEYFNALGLLKAWGGVVRGHGVQHHFLAGQDRLGDAASMGLGTVLFVVEPALVLSVLVLGTSALARPFRRRD
jgi:hypothetical protein